MNASDYGPWKPGIKSQLPSEVVPYITILREENVFHSIAEIDEICQFTGLAREDVAAFRPQRLAVHELLIRVSANISVPDGTHYEDLGVNFRSMALTLLDGYIRPNMQQITDCYDDLHQRVTERVEKELQSTLFAKPSTNTEVKGWWRLFKKKEPLPQPVSPEIYEAQIVATWKAASQQQDESSLQRAVYYHLSRVCGSIMTRHGRLRGEKDFLSALIARQVCNTYGSKIIGDLIEPMVIDGVSNEGYTSLPTQSHPVVMNVKGASASGKSTLRPLQHKLAQRLGLKWEEFALVSPDIWRKFLLDYKSLGEAYKYAAVCSGHELKIVDRKLDEYMSTKAEQNAIPHMLIDRFRFDSFASGSEQAGSNLLTRFAKKVFMFYMITPPHETVLRAWMRGLKVGRFKAVDDLLDHNIEAFAGMPKLFFTWAMNQEKEIHYEFLDNSVEKGQPPRTVAFGANGALNILDVECMMDIDRYKKININADTEEDVYPKGDAMAPENNLSFLGDCIKRLASVDIANFRSGKIAGRIRHGILLECNSKELKKTIPDEDTHRALKNLLPNIIECGQSSQTVKPPTTLDLEGAYTLGDWGR